MRNDQIVSALGAFREQKRIFHFISNNLSNAQTAGFKKDVPIFYALLNRSWNQGVGFQTEEVKTLFHQGNIHKTGNDLDLAIDGEGFFKIKTPDGIRYTRAGNFKLNKEGQLVTTGGFPVMGRNGEITIGGRPIVIATDGTIRIEGEEVDQINVVTFPDLAFLKKEGHSLFRSEYPQQEIEARESQVVQGALELSNVNPIEEMVDLIDSLRTYEACLKVIQAQNELKASEIGRV